MEVLPTLAPPSTGENVRLNQATFHTVPTLERQLVCLATRLKSTTRATDTLTSVSTRYTTQATTVTTKAILMPLIITGKNEHTKRNDLLVVKFSILNKCL